MMKKILIIVTAALCAAMSCTREECGGPEKENITVTVDTTENNIVFYINMESHGSNQ